MGSAITEHSLVTGRTGYSMTGPMLTICPSLVSLTRMAKGHGDTLPVFTDAAMKPKRDEAQRKVGGQRG